MHFTWSEIVRYAHDILIAKDKQQILKITYQFHYLSSETQNRILRYIYRNCNVFLFKTYIIEILGITDTSDLKIALYNSLIDGNVKVSMFIIKNFNLVFKECWNYRLEYLNDLVFKDKIYVMRVKFFCHTFRIKKKEIIEYNNLSIIRDACIREHFIILDWLINYYQINADDVPVEFLNDLYKRGHRVIVFWLYNKLITGYDNQRLQTIIFNIVGEKTFNNYKWIFGIKYNPTKTLRNQIRTYIKESDENYEYHYD